MTSEDPNFKPVKIDIVILSYAKSEELKQLTTQTIQTLLSSEDPKKIHFNILVLESEKKLSPFQFKNTTTLYPKESFGFNRYLNIGLKNTSENLICFCNNDLIFHKEWATEMLSVLKNNDSILSASTFCPLIQRDNGVNMNMEAVEGYEGFFSGWCFLIKRSLIDKIGYFDEKYKFWYADSDYLRTLNKYQIKNVLIPRSVVTHLNAVTSKSLNKKEYFNLTMMPQLYFNYKWKRDSYIIYKLKTIYFKLKFNFSLLR
ncbi:MULTISPECIES: glycosyltransferase family 2 protein [unclassified Pedobacter]|uniref:glycosyltransferase family 2 protein n=1 Tax=unclassified Pedobacter TaxID=2628915 RepID=UPI001DA5F107|nr:MULTISPECIES: hypothetical protein [unclassified Pedobacter]CAH0166348.1 hypothetical protein SRABI126_00914 [Pedobacter sp. Bi126]CAH0284842.1 hypothetical protein SRABI36_04126 [Pedobacter sp. Bi36]